MTAKRQQQRTRWTFVPGYSSYRVDDHGTVFGGNGQTIPLVVLGPLRIVELLRRRSDIMDSDELLAAAFGDRDMACRVPWATGGVAGNCESSSDLDGQE